MDKPKRLKTYCNICERKYDVRADQIFSGGEKSKYATRCPICGFARSLSIEEVENIFGELKV